MRWRRCVPLCLAIAASISPLYLVPHVHVSSRPPHESLEDENDTETLEDEEVGGGGGKRSEKSVFFKCLFLVEGKTIPG